MEFDLAEYLQSLSEEERNQFEKEELDFWREVFKGLPESLPTAVNQKKLDETKTFFKYVYVCLCGFLELDRNKLEVKIKYGNLYSKNYIFNITFPKEVREFDFSQDFLQAISAHAPKDLTWTFSLTPHVKGGAELDIEVFDVKDLMCTVITD